MQCRKKIGIHEAEHLLSNLFFTLYLQCNNLKLLFGARPKAEHQLITEGGGKLQEVEILVLKICLLFNNKKSEKFIFHSLTKIFLKTAYFLITNQPEMAFRP